MLRLTAEQGPDAGRIFATKSNYAVVGQRGEIALNDRNVSAYHALLQIQPNGMLVVTDLNSDSGTWMGYGERKAEKLTLKPGMCFKLGNTVLRVEFEQAPRLELPADDLQPGLAQVALVARANGTQPLRPLPSRANGTAPLWPQSLATRQGGTAPLRPPASLQVSEPKPEPVAQIMFTAPALHGAEAAPLNSAGMVPTLAPIQAQMEVATPVNNPAPVAKPALEPEVRRTTTRASGGLELEFDPDILAFANEPSRDEPVQLAEPEKLIIPSPQPAAEAATKPRLRPAQPSKEVEPPPPLPFEFRAIGAAYHSQGPVIINHNNQHGLRIALISALLLALGLAILILMIVQF